MEFHRALLTRPEEFLAREIHRRPVLENFMAKFLATVNALCPIML